MNPAGKLCFGHCPNYISQRLGELLRGVRFCRGHSARRQTDVQPFRVQLLAPRWQVGSAVLEGRPTSTSSRWRICELQQQCRRRSSRCRAICELHQQRRSAAAGAAEPARSTDAGAAEEEGPGGVAGHAGGVAGQAGRREAAAAFTTAGSCWRPRAFASASAFRAGSEEGRAGRRTVDRAERRRTGDVYCAKGHGDWCDRRL